MEWRCSRAKVRGSSPADGMLAIVTFHSHPEAFSQNASDWSLTLHRLPCNAALGSGKMYGIPWRYNKVLEFDPTTKAISLLGSFTANNFTWHGGALAKDGRIIAVPYNSPWVLEIGKSRPSPMLPWPGRG